jgi:plasmid stabilization system protein ParE
VSKNLLLQRAARAELRDAYEWYESQEHGLGERLLVAAGAAFLRIIRNPELYPVRFGAMRRTLVDTFPYAIFYTIHDEKVIVHAVFHTSRNPERLKSRLRRDNL